MTLSTKVILAHISSRAKPVFGASAEERRSSDLATAEPAPKRPKVSAAHRSLAKKLRMKAKH